MEKKKKLVPVGAMDRISQLPEPILHHILSHLPQNHAIQTCILSKPWRHIGPTLPKIEFRESSFSGSKQKFISVVENTLQRYFDQNLPIQELRLVVSGFEPNDSFSLLNEWIPIVIMKNTGLKTLSLSAFTFSLPSVVFQAEFLEELVLQGCKLNQTFNSTGKLKRLRKLSLRFVHIKEESLNNLSSHFPCLEELKLHSCSGFREFKLSSRTIKRLIIRTPDRPVKAAFNIDAANMLHFEFGSACLPSIISFATTFSRECKSRVQVWTSSDLEPTWLQKLYEILKALSQSQIFLDISYPLTYREAFCGCCIPVVVEHLCIKADYSPCRFQALLDSLFHICRPRYIQLPIFATSWKIFESKLVESVRKTLVNKGGMRQQDFENTNEWLPVKVRAMSNNQYFWFRLKW